MVDILSFLKDKLEEISIPYEFGEWTQTLSYPYFVGSFEESDSRYEDNHTGGTFTLDGWCRGEKIPLTLLTDRIEKKFKNLCEVVEHPWVWDTFSFPYGMVQDVSGCFFVRYGGSMTVPSGEDGLYRVTITLFTEEWKGE